MDVCEEGAFRGCGTLGNSCCFNYKYVFFSIGLLLTFLDFALVSTAYTGSSYNNDAIEATAWTIEYSTYSDDGNHDTVLAYYGLRQAYGPNGGGSYKYSDCSDYLDVCNDCYLAGKKAMVGTGFAIFFAIVLFILNCFRLCMDRVIVKVTAAVFHFMNFVCLASIMGIWNNECVANINSYVNDDGIILAVGPGYACIVVSFVFNFICFNFNIWTPTKDPLGTAPSAPAPGQAVVVIGGNTMQPGGIAPSVVVVNQPGVSPNVYAGQIQPNPTYAAPYAAPTAYAQPAYGQPAYGQPMYGQQGTATVYGAQPGHGVPMK